MWVKKIYDCTKCYVIILLLYIFGEYMTSRKPWSWWLGTKRTINAYCLSCNCNFPMYTVNPMPEMLYLFWYDSGKINWTDREGPVCLDCFRPQCGCITCVQYMVVASLLQRIFPHNIKYDFVGFMCVFPIMFESLKWAPSWDLAFSRNSHYFYFKLNELKHRAWGLGQNQIKYYFSFSAWT